ncbi:hypothetical protein B0H10DRAFT_1998654, partial [Mycena sp. CBHHK59/15]
MAGPRSPTFSGFVRRARSLTIDSIVGNSKHRRSSNAGAVVFRLPSELSFVPVPRSTPSVYHHIDPPGVAPNSCTAWRADCEIPQAHCRAFGVFRLRSNRRRGQGVPDLTVFPGGRWGACG